MPTYLLCMVFFFYAVAIDPAAGWLFSCLVLKDYFQEKRNEEKFWLDQTRAIRITNICILPWRVEPLFDLYVLVISQYEYDILVITRVRGEAEDEC